ncbi:peptidyl-tRNA hydrolase [Parasedimentitalea maritima]|uniref:Peptidyl-tRNA hydrolase n=1 Tax=Parasedimentitalea maritima TaxID=2578117 RepID=A0A6A4REJ2_9RHOB|nr:peptidyl-tRNA hydrolase [Zongyanglinia marina]KAE9627629.1 peptidyl-tRNA hydrolase [Zongyanglinia marina]
MLDGIDSEETVLRRRMLFRLLRGFNFDNPEFRGEKITDLVPDQLMASDLRQVPADKSKCLILAESMRLS